MWRGRARQAAEKTTNARVAAKRRQNAAHGVSRGESCETEKAPAGRKISSHARSSWRGRRRPRSELSPVNPRAPLWFKVFCVASQSPRKRSPSQPIR